MKTIFGNQEIMVTGLRPILSLKWNLSNGPHLPYHHFRQYLHPPKWSKYSLENQLNITIKTCSLIPWIHGNF